MRLRTRRPLLTYLPPLKLSEHPSGLRNGINLFEV